MKFRVVYYTGGKYAIEFRRKAWFSSWEELEYYEPLFEDWQPYLYDTQKEAIEFAKTLTDQKVRDIIEEGNSKIEDRKPVYI